MLFLAWLLAAVGLLVAYVVSLAGAMRTVPRLPWQEAVWGLPLPLVAAGLALWCLLRTGSSEAAGAWSWIAAAVPLMLAILTLLLMAVSYFDQPAGPI